MDCLNFGNEELICRTCGISNLQNKFMIEKYLTTPGFTVGMFGLPISGQEPIDKRLSWGDGKSKSEKDSLCNIVIISRNEYHLSLV